MKLAIIVVAMGMSTASFAQQNFFNVPSGEVANRKQVVLQEQVNMTTIYESNFMFTTGLAKNFELGMSIFNTSLGGISRGESASIGRSEVMINSQYAFLRNSYYSMSWGTITGIKLRGQEFRSFNYIMNSWNRYKWLKLAGGIYTTETDVKRGKFPVGFLGGLDIMLLPTIKLTSDIIVGRDDLSVWVGGFTWQLRKNWSLAAGYQHSSYLANTPRGLVVELTFRSGSDE